MTSLHGEAVTARLPHPDRPEGRQAAVPAAVGSPTVPASGPAGDAAMVFVFDPAGRTLLVRARGLLKKHWMPPGGHIDAGENAADAACRELAEELGIASEPGDLQHLGCCDKDLGTGTLTLFVLRRADTDMTVGDELYEARWFSALDCQQLPMLAATVHGLRLAASAPAG
jgi:8-oxo-dGTP pyrophosphatase MutT (NUDIX family)